MKLFLMHLLARTEQFLAFLKRNKTIFKRILGILLVIFILILIGMVWLPGLTLMKVVIAIISFAITIGLIALTMWCFDWL